MDKVSINVENYPIGSDAEAAADFERLSMLVIELNHKYGTRFDKYVPGNDEYATDDITSAMKFVVKKQSPLQLLEDYVTDWYNNYNNADIKHKTPEQLLEEAYQRIEKHTEDDDDEHILNNLQEIMIMMAKLSPSWYRG